MMEQDAILTGKIYVGGVRGYSNYEIAVQNGFEGTEAEWLEKITEDEADIVWSKIQEQIAAGTLNFSIDETYNSLNETLTLSIVAEDEESE